MNIHATQMVQMIMGANVALIRSHHGIPQAQNEEGAVSDSEAKFSRQAANIRQIWSLRSKFPSITPRISDTPHVAVYLLQGVVQTRGMVQDATEGHKIGRPLVKI